MAEEKKERLSRQEKKEQQLEAIRKLIEEKGTYYRLYTGAFELE